KERTALKSMAASKNVRPAITTFDQARHWLAVLAAELAHGLAANNSAPRKASFALQNRVRTASSTPRSKQIAFPFVRAFSAATILAPSERLWKMLFPGSGDIDPGVINVMLGFGGLEALETGQRGIEGFLGAKGVASTKKPSSVSTSASAKKPDTIVKAERRTASPSVGTKKDAAKSRSKHDFFGGAKRKAIEVVDDSSDSDIVEISPPPHAKRINSGSSGQTGGSSRSETPTPAVNRKDKDKSGTSKEKSTSKDKGKSGKAKGGIASFFAAAGSSSKTGKK
ncbi:DNA-directed DNA polymerase eta rad30, partial [Ceratobasidium sp. 392]